MAKAASCYSQQYLHNRIVKRRGTAVTTENALRDVAQILVNMNNFDGEDDQKDIEQISAFISR